MSKKSKKHKKGILVVFKDGKRDVIPKRLWDDYEVNHNLFIIKRNDEWIAFYALDIIACVVVK